MRQLDLNTNKKTMIEDLERGLYDIKDNFDYSYKTETGLTPEIILQISEQKNEPAWMTEFRLKSLQIYHE